MIINKILNQIKSMSRSRLTVIITIVLSAVQFANAQTAAEEDISTAYIELMLILTFGLILMAFAFLFYFGMGDRQEPEIKSFGLMKKIKSHLTALTPLEKEDEILLEDDYDGIKELDNRIPPWFSYLFYFTILFGIYYLLDYHVFKTGKLQAEEYQEEMSIANTQKAEVMNTGADINENNVTGLTDITSLSAGKEIFKTNCVPCHGPDGGGVVGPNFTDDYWIHGGGIKNIFNTIKYGVPAKGMISWQTQLNPQQMQEVASYVMTLHGTKPANPKAPEGTLYVDSTETK